MHMCFCVLLYFTACMLYYCNTVGWVWWDWGLIWRLTILLQCFDTVGWVTWPVKISSPSDLYCVEWDVKPYSTQLNVLKLSCCKSLILVLLYHWYLEWNWFKNDWTEPNWSEWMAYLYCYARRWVWIFPGTSKLWGYIAQFLFSGWSKNVGVYSGNAWLKVSICDESLNLRKPTTRLNMSVWCQF